jgi:hypothetical protein
MASFETLRTKDDRCVGEFDYSTLTFSVKLRKDGRDVFRFANLDIEKVRNSPALKERAPPYPLSNASRKLDGS